jgi:hypothetical protein
VTVTDVRSFRFAYTEMSFAIRQGQSLLAISRAVYLRAGASYVLISYLSHIAAICPRSPVHVSRIDVAVDYRLLSRKRQGNGLKQASTRFLLYLAKYGTSFSIIFSSDQNVTTSQTYEIRQNLVQDSRTMVPSAKPKA